jgi:hypothetical protein
MISQSIDFSRADQGKFKTLLGHARHKLMLEAAFCGIPVASVGRKARPWVTPHRTKKRWRLTRFPYAFKVRLRV